jgi:hypothetical protein
MAIEIVNSFLASAIVLPTGNPDRPFVFAHNQGFVESNSLKRPPNGWNRINNGQGYVTLECDTLLNINTDAIAANSLALIDDGFPADSMASILLTVGVGNVVRNDDRPIVIVKMEVKPAGSVDYSLLDAPFFITISRGANTGVLFNFGG